MTIQSIIAAGVSQAVSQLYELTVDPSSVNITPTRKEFTGDFTVVVFPYTKAARKKPEQIGEELGQHLVEQIEAIKGFNVIKGFLNLEVADSFWIEFLGETVGKADFGRGASKGEKVMVEFASPNTNKPLHLGHIRNILLGWSTSKILDAAGYEVLKVQIVNDRGIAICKSMLAWELFGNGETPASTGIKSDHFVGKYYVEFEKQFQIEYKEWQKGTTGQAILKEKKKEEQDEKAFFKAYKNTYFNEYSQLGKQAKEMLLAWEAGEEDTRNLWKKMNGWVYEGFDQTYARLGVTFDKLYFESDTYLLGKNVIEEGLKEGTFYQKEDGSVWIDLEDAKLDHKLVLRSDGTSVYMTQDIGTAMLRNQDYGVDKMVYVVADEQNYHFQVLFEIMKRLEEPYANGMYHLSYGMVELPEGKMKSREGTVVDADDLMDVVIEEARGAATESGGITELPQEKQDEIVRKVGLAALKFFMIKVQPKRWMTFNPAESVDMTGQTGPYIQYSYVRINKVSQRAVEEGVDLSLATQYTALEPSERELLINLYQFPDQIQLAAAEYDPSTIANYCYHLAKLYSKFYSDLPMFKADPIPKAFRLQLSAIVGQVLKSGLDLLGIEVPDQM